MRLLNGIGCFVFLLILASIAGIYFSNTPFQSLLYNSDALYLPTLFDDLFSQGGSLKQWYLTPSPYYIPDFLTYLPAYLLGRDTYQRMLFFSLIQIGFVFFAQWLTSRYLHIKHSFLVATAITSLLAWLIFFDYSSFCYLITSAHHYGTFIISCVFVSLWIHRHIDTAVQSKRLLSVTLYSGFFAVSLSDSLFIAQTTLPLAATTLLFDFAQKKLNKNTFFLSFFILLSSFLGFKSYNIFVSHSTRYNAGISPTQFSEKLVGLSDYFQRLLTGHPSYYAIFLVYSLISIYALISMFRNPKGVQHPRFIWFTTFTFLSSIANLLGELFVTGIAIHGRYLIPVFTWPVIVTTLFIALKASRQFPFLSLAVSIACAGALAQPSYKAFKNTGVTKNYYPADIACIDTSLEKEGLNNGIAQYWDAKHIQKISRLPLNLAQYFNDLSPMYWITTERYFRPFYDFAIISRHAEAPYIISKDLLNRLNGAPVQEIQCGDRILLVYGKEKMRVRKFLSVGDHYEWKACELPSTSIATKTQECYVETNDQSSSGFLTFGPMEHLAAGQYQFNISYSSSNSKNEESGQWDVVLARPKHAKPIKTGVIMGSASERNQIEGLFELAEDDAHFPVEIRTQVTGNHFLRVESLSLTKMK